MAYMVDAGGGKGKSLLPGLPGSTVDKPYGLYPGIPNYIPVTPRPDYSTVSGAMGSQATGGGTSGGSGSSGGTVTVQQPSTPSYYDQLGQIQAQQQAARDEAYRVGLEQQKKNLDYSTGQVNNAADRALQEAYINKMMTLKNLPQTLSAQGLNGGVAESTTAGLYNNYGNARNEIETERLDQIGALQQAYNNNVAQLEAQRASGAAASLSELVPVLTQLAANNPTELVSMQQASAAGTTGGARLVWDDEQGRWVYR